MNLSVRYKRATNVMLVIGHLAALSYLVQIQLRADDYFSAALVGLSLGVVAFGHAKEKKWAAQATTFLLLGGNLFAIFYYFTPFSDEISASSFWIRVLKFSVLTVCCVGLSLVLYLQQRKSI